MSALTDYRLLGRSGLRVSPLALGTMTFGESWGEDERESRRVFDTYVDRGGNFIDTANYYAHGQSEEMLGTFIDEKRDALVIATKYSFATQAGDPNSGGNHRKSLMRGIEGSLRRLKTDYIDLYYLHVWDDTTPGDEIMRALDDATAQGKILYAGISDTPAWQVARMQTLSELRGWTPFVALQIEYNLIQRTAERDLIPAARALGLGVTPWSPLASGILSGKYASRAPAGDSKRRALLAAAGRIDSRAVSIADALHDVAEAAGVTSAQAALAWILANPAVTAPIAGARTAAQLESTLAGLEIELATEHKSALDAATAFELGFPHDFLNSEFIRAGVAGGASIRPRS